jgi:hypothetical protein
MANHGILARSASDARKLARQLDEMGYEARATKYNRHHVVLAYAPQAAVNDACRRVSFEIGL